MANLPDVPFDEWAAWSASKLDEFGQSLKDRFEFDKRAEELEGQIPFDFSQPGGVDPQDEINDLMERERQLQEYERQQAEYERQQQEYAAQQQMLEQQRAAQQAQDDAQTQAATAAVENRVQDVQQPTTSASQDFLNYADQKLADFAAPPEETGAAADFNDYADQKLDTFASGNAVTPSTDASDPVNAALGSLGISFPPNVPLDVSQIDDRRGQFAPSTNIQYHPGRTAPVDESTDEPVSMDDHWGNTPAQSDFREGDLPGSPTGPYTGENATSLQDSINQTAIAQQGDYQAGVASGRYNPKLVDTGMPDDSNAPGVTPADPTTSPPEQPEDPWSRVGHAIRDALGGAVDTFKGGMPVDKSKISKQYGAEVAGHAVERATEALAGPLAGPISGMQRRELGPEQIARENAGDEATIQRLYDQLDEAERTGDTETASAVRDQILPIEERLNAAYKEDPYQAAARDPNREALETVTQVGAGAWAGALAPDVIKPVKTVGQAARQVGAAALDPAGQAIQGGFEAVGKAAGALGRVGENLPAPSRGPSAGIIGETDPVDEAIRGLAPEGAVDDLTPATVPEALPELPSRVAGPDEFIALRNRNPREAFMSPLTPDKLRGLKPVVLGDEEQGLAGYVLTPDGDIQNVFNVAGESGAKAPGLGARAVLDAVENGGRTLDAYDGYLPDYYHQFGFDEVGRVPFNREYAPPNWDYAKYGEPDVVLMARRDYHPGDTPDAILERINAKRESGAWRVPTPAERFPDWDSAEAARDAYLAGSDAGGGRVAGVGGEGPGAGVRPASQAADLGSGPPGGGSGLDRVAQARQNLSPIGREVVEKYDELTPQRAQAAKQDVLARTMTFLGEGLPDADRARVQSLVEGTHDALVSNLEENKVVSTVVEPPAINALLRTGQITTKADLPYERGVDITQTQVGAERVPTREQAGRFYGHEAESILGAMGGHGFPDAAGIRDEDAPRHLYAHVTDGQPMQSTAGPSAASTLRLVWEPETPRVSTESWPYALRAPAEGIHATSMSSGADVKALYRDSKTVRGATYQRNADGTIDVLGWDERGIGLPSGRKIMDTDHLVGPEGEDVIRANNLLLSMPAGIRKQIRQGNIDDPQDLAAILQRGDPGRSAPYNQAAIAPSRTRSEALLIDPSMQNVKAIMLTGTRKLLDTVVPNVPNPVTGRTGMTRLDAARAVRQKILEDTGKDVPIIWKDPTAESKLLSDAVVLEGPDVTLAPTRGTNIRDRYVSRGLSDLGFVGDDTANAVSTNPVTRRRQVEDARIAAEGGPSKIERRQAVRDQLEQTSFLSPEQAAAFMGDRPEYLDEVIDYMKQQRRKVLSGGLNERDVAKAWYMTVASQGSAEQGAMLTSAKTGLRFPENYMDARGNIRPEEAAAAWLFSPRGQQALDDIQRGVFNPEAWAEGAAVRKAFGDDRFRTSNVFGTRAPLKPEKGIYGMEHVPELTRQMNAALAAGDMRKFEDIVGTMNGVSSGKVGFVKHLLGFGDSPTLDAVELNYWLTGQGDIGRLQTPEADFVRRYKEFQMDPNLRSAAKAKLEERFQQLKDMGVDEGLRPVEASHIMHHWLWDKAKNATTSHQGMYDAMNNAAIPPGLAPENPFRAGLDDLADEASGIRTPGSTGPMPTRAAIQATQGAVRGGVAAGYEESQQEGSTPGSVLAKGIAGTGVGALTGLGGRRATRALGGNRAVQNAARIVANEPSEDDITHVRGFGLLRGVDDVAGGALERAAAKGRQHPEGVPMDEVAGVAKALKIDPEAVARRWGKANTKRLAAEVETLRIGTAATLQDLMDDARHITDTNDNSPDVLMGAMDHLVDAAVSSEMLLGNRRAAEAIGRALNQFKNPLNAQLGRQLFENLDRHAQTVQKGAEALEQAKKGGYQLPERMIRAIEQAADSLDMLGKQSDQADAILDRAESQATARRAPFTEGRGGGEMLDVPEITGQGGRALDNEGPQNLAVPWRDKARGRLEERLQDVQGGLPSLPASREAAGAGAKAGRDPQATQMAVRENIKRSLDGAIQKELNKVRNKEERAHIQGMADQARDLIGEIVFDTSNQGLKDDLGVLLGEMAERSNYGDTVAARIGETYTKRMDTWANAYMKGVEGRIASAEKQAQGQADTFMRGVERRNEQAAGRERRAMDQEAVKALSDQLRSTAQMIRDGVRDPSLLENIDDLRIQMMDYGQLGKDKSYDVKQSLTRQGLLRFAGKVDEDKIGDFVTLLRSINPDKPETMTNIMRLMKKGTLTDNVIEYAVANMLSSPATQLINISSNAMQGAAALGIKKPLEIMLDPIVNPGNRQRYASELGASGQGLMSAIETGLQAAGETMRYGYSRDTMERAAQMGDFGGVRRELLTERFGAPGAILHAISTRPLQAMDELFGSMLYSANLYALAERRAKQTGSTREAILGNLADNLDLVQEAGKKSDYSLLKSKSTVTDNLAAIGRIKGGESNEAVELTKHMLFPFTRTPWNVLKQGIEFSPVGTAKNIVNLGTNVAGVTGGGAERRVDLAANVASGLGMAALGWTLWSQGKLSGDGPSDYNDRRMLESTGWRPRSMLVGDQWVSYDSTPFAVPLGSIATGLERYQEKVSKGSAERSPEAMWSAVAGFGVGTASSFLNQSFVKNAADIYEDVRSGDIKAEGVGSNMATRFIPAGSMVAWLGRLGDSVQRETNMVDDPFQAKLKERVPVLRSTLPERTDVTGRAMPNEQSAPSGLLIVPRRSTQRQDPVIDTFRAADVNISAPPKELDIGGGLKMDLTKNEQLEFKKIYGQRVRELTQENMRFINDGRSDVAERKKIAEDIKRTARKDARDTFIGRYSTPELERRAGVR